MFSVMHLDAYREGQDGFNMNFRFYDEGVFHLNRLQAKTKTIIQRMGYPSSLIIVALHKCLTTESEEEKQNSVIKLASACDSFGLTFITKNTEGLYQPHRKRKASQASSYRL